jgi:Protein of unknown function (DUF4241)
MDKSYVTTWSWANLVVDPDTGANLIAFSAGWGDGGYVTYVGYDTHSTIVCFTTDFAVLGDEG